MKEHITWGFLILRKASIIPFVDAIMKTKSTTILYKYFALYNKVESQNDMIAKQQKPISTSLKTSVYLTVKWTTANLTQYQAHNLKSIFHFPCFYKSLQSTTHKILNCISNSWTNHKKPRTLPGSFSLFIETLFLVYYIIYDI